MKITADINALSPVRTFMCGQCFRWRENGDGSFSGIVRGKMLFVKQVGGKVEISGDVPEKFLREYFDLDVDYDGYIARLSENETLRKACEMSRGIRILRQEPFETLLSFIISQNNNIPRISGIISRFCEKFGEKAEGNGFAFPTAERLRGIEAEDLAELRAGFRARYIADAVSKINSGEIIFEEIDALPLDTAREKLKTIVGVGDKVADCVLLFAFHKLNAFPKDVWIKRIMSENFPEGLPKCAEGIEGIAQQYLFDHYRNIETLKVDNDKQKLITE